MNKIDLKHENKQTKPQRAMGLICLFLFTALTLIFGVLIVLESKNGFVKANRLLIIALLVFVVGLLVFFGIAFEKKGKIFLFRLSVTVMFLCAFISTGYYVLLKSGFLTIFSDSAAYEEFLAGAGGWMAVIYVLLQFLQVIVLPIPSLVSTLAGVALFGPHLALLYSLIGILLGSYVAFFIGRKIGYRAVVWIVGEEELNKWQKKLKGKDNFILTAMFLLPLFPDDVLCFVAGLSSMSNVYFLLMLFVCRLIGIAATCYSIQIIPFNTWWGVLLWGLIYVAVIILFVLFYKNLEKINKWWKKKRKKF